MGAIRMFGQAGLIFAASVIVILAIHVSTGKLYGVEYYQNRGWMFMTVGVLYLIFGFVMTRNWHF